MKKIVLKALFGLLAWMGISPGLVVAQGIRKQVAVAKQVSLGTANFTGGQLLRRVQSNFKLDKATYESEEIVSHQQSTGSRHGVQSVTGKINGLLSPGTYKLFMASAVRKDFAAGSTSGAQTNITAAAVGANGGTFTRAAGSFITDGFRVGDVVRWTGWTTTGTANNSHNMLITALTATVMTVITLDAVAVGAKASGDSVTATVTGKKAVAPLTGHTDDIFTFEEWYPDVAQSEQFVDCKLNSMQVDMPASGNCKVNFDFVGLKRTRNTTQQMTTPAAETTTTILASVSGALIVNGAEVVNVTSVQLSVDEGASADGPVVGSDFSPDISRGRTKVTGSFAAYFSDASLQALYEAETVLNLVIVVAADSSAAADFVAFNCGRVKLGGDAPDDGEKGIMRTFPFVAEINSAGGAGLANDQTILSIQDSQA